MKRGRTVVKWQLAQLSFTIESAHQERGITRKGQRPRVRVVEDDDGNKRTIRLPNVRLAYHVECNSPGCEIKRTLFWAIEALDFIRNHPNHRTHVTKEERDEDVPSKIELRTEAQRDAILSALANARLNRQE